MNLATSVNADVLGNSALLLSPLLLSVLLSVITFATGRGHCCLSLCPVAVAGFHSLFTNLVVHLCGERCSSSP